MILHLKSVDDVEASLEKIKHAAAKAHEWIAQQSGDPLQFLRSVKFERRGFHPISGESLNLIEQVNQTWTYAVALAATRALLQMHPESRGFRLAPGAHMAQELDIMSELPGLVGAEVFAATSPESNGKLRKDLKKLSSRTEQYRYVFFSSPSYGHLERYEKGIPPGIDVWSVVV